MKLTTRNVIATDQAAFEQFATHTANNLLDPDIFNYPTLSIRMAERDSKPIVFAPTQKVTMMESLAINPEASTKEVALGLAALVRDLQVSEPLTGIREVYFVCQDQSTADFASKYFEELPYRTFRMKVGPNVLP